MQLDAPTRFSCDVHPGRDRVHVTLSGDLDLATVAQARDAIDGVIRTGSQHVVIDLSSITLCGTTGIRMLLAAQQLASEHGSTLTVVPGPPAVQRVLSMVGLEKVFAGEPARTA